MSVGLAGILLLFSGCVTSRPLALSDWCVNALAHPPAGAEYPQEKRPYYIPYTADLAGYYACTQHRDSLVRAPGSITLSPHEMPRPVTCVGDPVVGIIRCY